MSHALPTESVTPGQSQKAFANREAAAGQIPASPPLYAKSRNFSLVLLSLAVNKFCGPPAHEPPNPRRLIVDEWPLAAAY
jgi:hypothetical protein